METSLRSTIFFLCVLSATTLPAQFQANDECTGATSIEVGVNPGFPFGQSGMTYANTFASNSAAFSPFNCTQITKDVFFTFLPPCTGNYRVSLCTPPGFASGTLVDSVLEVYTASACPGGGTPIACNDDSCALGSETTFFATAGVSYRIRVGSYSTTAAGTFYLTATPIDLPNNECAGAAPLGPGSIRIRNLNGPPNTPCLSFFTVFGGAYPYGPFFGLDPSFTEIALQIAAGAPPFANFLNAAGESSFGPLPGAPSGLTLYGVSVPLIGGFFGAPSPPTTFTIP